MTDQKINKRIAAVRRRFGSQNSLLTLLLEWSVLTELQRPNMDALKIQGLVINLLTQLFGSSGCFVTVCKYESGFNRKLYRFLEDDYNLNYNDYWTEFRTKLRSDLGIFQGNSSIYDKFIYVVGPNSELRFLCDPQPVYVSAKGRRNPRDYPFHPFLASEFGFEVSAAGEFSILWARQDSSPRVMYINNISGHFRPKNLSASELLGIILDCNPILSATRILVVCNDSSLLYSKALGGYSGAEN